MIIVKRPEMVTSCDINMAAVVWLPRTRKYEHEKSREACKHEITTSHPLKAITVTMTDGGKVKRAVKGSRGGNVEPASTPLGDPLSAALEGTDPLSMMAAEASDPLSQIAAEMSLSEKKSGRSDSKSSTSSYDLDESFEPWYAKRTGILTKYTTSEKLSITTSFLSGSDKDRVVQKNAPGTVTEKVRNRLEQLDDFEEGSVKEMLNLSQQDYINRIEELNNALINAWEQDQRVKALKIAIQCAKLLADISVIQFYPSKMVLITDILDTFGRLVFDRIRNKAQYIPKGSSVPIQLPEDFTPDQVPESAKETCRNWFFKIASIRELIPRFYVETAILKCYSFLTSGEYNQALMRLAVMIRGIGDPLVAVYARCYLCRVGVDVAPKIRDHLMPCFDDFLATYSQIQGDSVQNILAVQKLELPKYLTLYSPALDWILQCLAHRASEKVLVDVLEKSKKHCNSALLLNSVMSAFKPEYISSRSLQFIEMIKECEETGFPKYMLYRTLGVCVSIAQPIEQHRLTVLNDVWKVVMKLKTPAEYISCAEVWIEYVVKNFSKREVNTILGDIIKHMTPDRAFEDFYPQLQSIAIKILDNIHDFSVLFAMDKFLPFIDMFQKDSVKVEVCKSVMEAYGRNQAEPTSDPVITNALMFICKTMHDSVNALTLEDEIRLIGSLINGFIRSVTFGRDFEQQLSFYVEARAAFSNIDSVLMFLVQNVNRLSIETRQIVKGNHTRKTASFVRACAAYSFITIPSLMGIFSRLNLYLVSGQVALLNQCLSQADAFFKAAISTMPELPKTIEIDGKLRSAEPLLHEYLSNFVAALLVVPDNPEQGVLYLLRGLLNVLNELTWDPNSDTKAHIYMNVLVMLSASCQETYIYHVDKIDSNDSLYGHDQKYLAEVHKICHTLFSEVMEYLKGLDKRDTGKRQASLALELFSKVVTHGDLKNADIAALAANLWGFLQKNGQVDNKYRTRTLEYLKKRGQSAEGKAFADLAANLPLQSRA